MPPHNATSQCHLKTPPHNATSKCHLTTTPVNVTSQCHLKTPPHNATSLCHLKTPPHNATSQHTSQCHLTTYLSMPPYKAPMNEDHHCHLSTCPSATVALLGTISSHWLSTSPCHSSSFCSSDWPEYSQPFPTADIFLPPCYFCICLNQAVILKMEVVGFSKPSE